MTFPTVVDYKQGNANPVSITTSHPMDVPVGFATDLLLAIVSWGEPSSGNTLSWTGWTALGQTVLGTAVDGYVAAYYRVADGSEGATTTATTLQPSRLVYQIYRISGYTGVPSIATFLTNPGGSGATTFDPPSLASGFGSSDTLWIPFVGYSSGTRTVTGYPAGYTDGVNLSPGNNAWPGLGSARVTSTASSENPGAFTLSSTSWQSGSTIAIRGGTSGGDVPPVDVPLPDPPVPAGVLLEIYASDPGSARWDVAKWDEALWSSAGWQDVTPQGITVDISWGSNKPDNGILVVPDAASWAVDYYDPTRILDPSNDEGPYFGDLIPGLPIRVSHRGVVVRVGTVTGLSYDYASKIGYMRAADNITTLANAEVPSDTPLSDTLYARTQDAIEAAGLALTVAAPVGTDPALSPWVTGTREWTVWEWIKDAAQEVLYIPIIDRLGVVTFRPWANPLVRARSVASDEMIDLQVISDYSGLYSVVRATDAADTVIERALTPPPRYGARVYERTEHTLNAAAWAEAVLADRAMPNLRWQPGEIFPLTALAVEKYATIEAIERISIAYPETDPAIFVTGIVVGGDIRIFGKLGDEARWRFTFYTAQTANEPLIETGGDPTEYLLRTGGGEYVYPST